MIANAPVVPGFDALLHTDDGDDRVAAVDDR